LLHFLEPETFQGTVKAVNETMLTVFTGIGLGRVDFGLFYAILAAICADTPKKRKCYDFYALVWLSAQGRGFIVGHIDIA
jgi:hypothetical protein